MEWLGRRRPGVIACDTETEGLEYWRDRIRLIQFGDAESGWAMEWDRWSGLAQEVFRRYEGRIAMHNFQFDSLSIRKYGMKDILRLHQIDDTRTKAHILDSSRRTGLKSLADSLLGYGSGSQSDLHSMMKVHNWDWRDVPFDLQQYWVYAAMDTVLTARIDDILDGQLVGQQRELYDIEMLAQTELLYMIERGIRVDLDYCHQQALWLPEQAQIVRAEFAAQYDPIISELRGKPTKFNLTSGRMVAEVMMAEGWEPNPENYTASGHPQMTKEIIATLAGAFPVADAMIEVRHLTKMASSYFENLINMADGDLIHCSINPLGARTGRMTVTGPALQTIPRGPLVRDAFIARDGNTFVLCDYDQMEVRITADQCGDEALIRAVMEEEDIHRWTASQIYGVPQSEVTPHQRQVTKNAVYAIIYGAGIPKFAATAGITVSQGAEFMRRYDSLFPEINRWKNRLDSELRANVQGGWTHTVTPYGRIQRAPIDKSYVLVNYRVQGIGADVLKLKICELANAGLTEYMVLPVHDEIIFDVPKAEAEEVKRQAVEIMTDSKWKVPLTVDGSIYERWGDKYR